MPLDLIGELDAEALVKRERCTVGLWLSALAPDDRAAVEAAILSRHTSSQLRAKLAEHFPSFTMNAETLQRHRRRVRDGGEGCACRRLTS